MKKHFVRAAALTVAAALLLAASGCGTKIESTVATAQAPVVQATVAPVQTAASAPAEFSFAEYSSMKLPSDAENLQYGQIFHLAGMVRSTSPLRRVRFTVSGADGASGFAAEVSFAKDAAVTEYALSDAEATAEKSSLAELAAFDTLAPASYTYQLTAEAFGNATATLATGSFAVEQNEWLQLISNNLRNNYPKALAFFGSRERFMFKYKWAEGRNITQQPDWAKKYIKSTPGVAGRSWQAHIDAMPYCEAAMQYLENTYIRVSGNGRDSGVIRLSELAVTNNGSYVPRFVSDRTFVSHHAFGTAFDINAYIEPFNNVESNHAVIRSEVADKLQYDGIKEQDGKKYYSFTYSGSWTEYYSGVPASLLNYLLYELAFYRAGFCWGYYYTHTCDAMHFTLSELDYAAHSAENSGLRKIYDYID